MALLTRYPLSRAEDGRITCDELVRISKDSKLLQRYRKALSRMWAERSQIFTTEMEQAREEKQGWLSSQVLFSNMFGSVSTEREAPALLLWIYVYTYEVLNAR